MLSRSIKSLLLFTALVFGMQNYATFYAISGWKSPEGYDYDVFCESDYHKKCVNDTIGQTQQAQLIAQAKKCNAFIIAGDMNDYNDNVEQITEVMNAFEIEKKQYALRSLIKQCRKNNIQHKNIEFRYATTILMEIIKENRQDMFDAWFKLSAEEIKSTEKEIATYKDLKWPQLQNFYVNFLKQKRDETLNANSFVELLPLICQMLDARIMHALYIKMHEQNKDQEKRTIFICAGGLHIDSITALLPKLGFKRMRAEKEMRNMKSEELEFEGQGYDKKIKNHCAIDVDQYFAKFDKQKEDDEAMHKIFLESIDEEDKHAFSWSDWLAPKNIIMGAVACLVGYGVYNYFFK